MPDNHEAFWSAVKAGDAAQVQAVLAAEPALAEARTDGGVSAVLLAVYYGHAPVGELVLAARPNSARAGGAADVFEAAALGHTAQVEALVASDATLVNAYAQDGFTPLGLAAYFGHAATLETLLARGADPNLAARNSTHVRPLHSAVANRDAATALTLAETLLRHGADVNAQQEGGYSPLHEAAFHGEAALAGLLLRHGADPQAKNSDGLSPLDLAEKHGHGGTAALLRGG